MQKNNFLLLKKFKNTQSAQLWAQSVTPKCQRICSTFEGHTHRRVRRPVVDAERVVVAAGGLAAVRQVACLVDVKAVLAGAESRQEAFKPNTGGGQVQIDTGLIIVLFFCFEEAKSG